MSRKKKQIICAALVSALLVAALSPIYLHSRRLSLNRDLVQSAADGDVPEARRLLDAGADPNALVDTSAPAFHDLISYIRSLFRSAGPKQETTPLQEAMRGSVRIYGWTYRP